MASLALRVTLSIVLIALSGCSTLRRSTPPSQTEPREPSSLSRWQASGRIAVSGVESGGSGSFNWMQRDGNTTVQLRGPVGIGSLRLTIANDALSVASADGREFVAEQAEEELAARLGASVPTKNLRYWLVGIAAPGEHQWSTSGETSTLVQNEWRIDYQKFQIAAGARVPAKFVAASGPAKV